MSALVLILLIASVCVHATDGIGEFSAFPTPYGFSGVIVRMGWYNCTQAWYYCVATNNIRFAETRALGGQSILAPKLSSALVPKISGGDIAAQPLYMVTNSQNPPIFSTTPRQPAYSALWQVFEITWKDHVTPRPICNAEPASLSNPQGLPDSAEADIVPTQVVMDCPILVLGPLTDPFVSDGSNYKIPQAGNIDPKIKAVFMPAWLIYRQDPLTKRVNTFLVQITDVGDQELASFLGANLASGLLNIPDSDTTDFFVMRGPKPPFQLPLVKDCPNNIGASNTNYNYSPVMRYVILKRNIIPPTLIKSLDTLDLLLMNGELQILKDNQRINAPVIVGG